MVMNILPNNIPPIIGRLHISYPLVAMMNHQDYQNWLNSHYVQLQCCLNYIKDDSLDYCFSVDWIEWWMEGPVEDKYPLLDIRKFHHDQGAGLHQLIIDSIDQGYYVMTKVNDFHIPHRTCYQTIDFRHIIWVFGYSTVNESYDVVGFNENYIYEATKVSFAEFEKAYFSTGLSEEIILIKAQNEIRYPFDPGFLIRQLENFLYSRYDPRDLSYYPDPENQCIFGFRTYEYIKKYMEDFIQKKVGYDSRTFHILWEHKECMCNRIKFLQENNYIQGSGSLYDKYREIAKKVFMARNLFLKYRMTKNPNLLDKVSQYIGNISIEEEPLIISMIAEIGKQQT